MRVEATRSIVLALLLAAMPLVTPALARQFTDDEKRGLADAIQKFDDLMKAGDFGAVVDASIPPKLLQSMSDKYKVPVDQFKPLVVQQMQQAMKTVKIDSYSMDLDGADYEETADGTPYALVPSETVMEIGSNKIKATADTLALIDDDGKWYLLNVGQASQVEILKSVYPSFADITFPEGKQEPVQ
jgi:hypothetical protein